jgi:L-asparagine oxygenase
MSWKIEISKEELEILFKSISETITVRPSEDPEIFCSQLKQIPIPESIKECLTDFARNGSNSGFLLFQNILEPDIPRTPPGNHYHVGETTNLSKIQGIMMSKMCEMIAYEAEGYGKLYQDILPIYSMASVQTSVGSNTELEIHTEQAFSQLRPDMISLACLRGDINALTYILPVNRILENITNKEMELLYQPLWKMGVDVSFKLHGKEFIEGDIRGPFAILNGSRDDPQLIFDQDLMFGMTEESHKLIAKIVSIYYQHRITHNLKPGEIIFIDNRRAVHGMSSFSPKYDGYDRFLIRCFGTLDYEKSSEARSPEYPRMIQAMYS